MILSHLLLPPLLALASQPLDSPTAIEIRWAPKAGVRLHRVVETKHLLAAELQSQGRGEQQVVSQRKFELRTTQNLDVTDTIIEVGPERPSRLRRFYQTSDFVAFTDMGSESGKSMLRKLKGASSLALKSVLFTWVPEDGEYGRYYDDIEGVEEILPGLNGDLSKSSLLPRHPVELGGSWELDPSVMRDVFDCGGLTDMALANNVGGPAYRTMRMGVGFNIEQLFAGTVSGKATGRLMGVEENEAGRKIALMQLEFDVAVEREMKDEVAGGMAKIEQAAGVVLDSAMVNLTLKGKGLVKWDIDGGHLSSIEELKADERIETTLVKARKVNDNQIVDTQVLVMVGTVYHKETVTEVE